MHQLVMECLSSLSFDRPGLRRKHHLDHVVAVGHIAVVVVRHSMRHVLEDSKHHIGRIAGLLVRAQNRHVEVAQRSPVVAVDQSLAIRSPDVVVADHIEVVEHNLRWGHYNLDHIEVVVRNPVVVGCSLVGHNLGCCILTY